MIYFEIILRFGSLSFAPLIDLHIDSCLIPLSLVNENKWKYYI